MKKFFVLLFGLIMVTVMGGCLNFAAIFPFLNQAPVIISEPIINATEDQPYLYQLEASDPNGDTLTYTFTIKPEGMDINSESGLISWTPTNNQVGNHHIIVKISDGKLSINQNFEIEVINVNNSPQILSSSPNNIDIKINEGDSVKFEIQAQDIDLNTTLSYQWLLNGKKVSSSTGLGNDSKSSWIYSAGYGDYSQKIVKVLVSDGELEDYMQWNIAIKDTSPPASATLNTITSPTNISPQILSGTKEANTSIWINGTEVVPFDSSTDWSYSYNLSEGTNNISITSRDAAGNESASITTTIILDTNTPEAPTLDDVVSPTNVSLQILSGTKETNTSIWINSSEVVPINPSNTWNYDFNLSEGENNISITSQDFAGNVSDEATVKIILDTISPTVPTLNEVITPTNISIQILSGTKEANTSIWINGTEVVSINSSVNWSHPYSLSEGINNIFITSRDAVGNESSAVTTTLEYDLNIYVNAENTSGIEDGTKTHPFNTIAEGIDAAAPGKSVLVSAGTYNEQLIVNKDITLQGASQDNTFITGSGLTENLISLEADNITISGFTIDGASNAAKGIYFNNYSSININNNIIQNNTSYGINYTNSSPTIENNDIKSNDYSGIDVGIGGAGIVRNNSLIFNKYGIRTCGDSSPEITRNNISNNNTGIYCRESATPIISYNTISNNTGYGILIDNILGNLVNPDIGGGEGGSAGKNNINGNYIHGVRNKTTHNIYAKYNWWGNVAGPKYPYHTSSSGDWAFWSGTGSEIIFTPYLTTEP
jgi:parallel beta-helix repeat protein